MPECKYVKPKSKEAEVYRGKEMKDLVEVGLKKVFGRDGRKVTPKQVKNVVNAIIGPCMGGELVVIIEKYPLNSKQARGKSGNKVYSVITKTGTIRVAPLTNPRNPKTQNQQSWRKRYRDTVAQWNALPEPEKEKYHQKAKKLSMTGYNYFMQECLGTE